MSILQAALAAARLLFISGYRTRRTRHAVKTPWMCLDCNSKIANGQFMPLKLGSGRYQGEDTFRCIICNATAPQNSTPEYLQEGSHLAKLYNVATTRHQMYIDCTATPAEYNEIASLPDYIKEENKSDDDDTNDDDDDCDKDCLFPEDNQHQLDLYSNFDEAKSKLIQFAKRRNKLSLAREQNETWQNICARTAEKLKTRRRKYEMAVWHGDKAQRRKTFQSFFCWQYRFSRRIEVLRRTESILAEEVKSMNALMDQHALIDQLEARLD